MTPQERIDFITPGLKEMYRRKYNAELQIEAQQIVDDLRPLPTDEKGRPLTRQGRPVQPEESEAMKLLVTALAEIVGQIKAFESRITALKALIPDNEANPELTGVAAPSANGTGK